MPQANRGGSTSTGAAGSTPQTAKRTPARASAAKPATAKRTTAAAKPAAKRTTAASKPAAAKRTSAAAKRTSAAKPAASRSTAKPASPKAAAKTTASAAKAKAKPRKASKRNTPEARLEAVAERLRKLNERIIEAGREAGESTLTTYEKALKAIAGGLEKGPGRSDIEWVAHLAGAQAKMIRELTDSLASAARDRLK